MNVKRYGRWLLVLLVISLLSAPISAQDDNHSVVYDHIGFTYPAYLVSRIQIETVTGVPYSENIIVAETYPEHVRFSFGDYLGDGQFRLPYPFEAPQILVYATGSIREFGYDYLDQLTALESLLRERPDLSTYTGAAVRLPEVRLPFLPTINSAQVLRSHPQYVEIPGVGSGIRYVTYYSQESAPISDREIFYTFQGVMAGGNYYVSAILPVKTGVLPGTIDTTGIDWDTFASRYSDTYLPQTFAQIDSLTDDDFTPPLHVLDAVIQSITFATGTTGWQTYTDTLAGYSFLFPTDHQICASEHTVEFIPCGQSYNAPEQDQCALSYQANPISAIASTDDEAFQAFRRENHPDSFTDYQEETLLIHDRQATRVSGIEVETGLRFQLVRIDLGDSYLIFKALGDENITILYQMIASIRFLKEAKGAG